MATRGAPRSNASSASSSSTSSRKAYRNASFGKDRGNLNSDPWVTSDRSAYGVKPQQQQSRAQWGQNSNQAGNSGISIAEESESRLSWRSQKQAVDSYSSYSDRGRLKGAQQPDQSYEASPFRPQGQPAEHTSKGQRNRANYREQSFYAHKLRHSEQSTWERHQPSSTKQNSFVSEKFTHGSVITVTPSHNYNQGHMSGKKAYGRHGFPASNSNYTPEIRGSSASFQRGFRDDPVNSNHGFGGQSGKSSQGSRHFAGGRGEAEVQRVQGDYRGWERPSALNTRGLGEKIDNFRPLTIRDGIGQSNVGAASRPSPATNRPWEGMGAITGSWADECCDDAPLTYDVVAKRVDNTYRGNSDVASIRSPNSSTDSHINLDTGVVNRDKWRQESWQGSNVKVGAGTSIHTNTDGKQGSSVNQGEARGNTSSAQRHGSFKQSASMVASDQTDGKAGDISKGRVSLQKEVSFGGSEVGKEAVMSKNQVSPSQADVEGSDDVTLPFIMGTCEDMCPLKEREQRERLRDLAVFERLNNNPSKTSRELAVKKFCRTFTGVKLLSDDVRPLRILWSTLQYLLNLLNETEFPFDVVHNFLFDRTRAIRQELGMQRIANSQAINMYEEIVRFHILSEHELNQRGSGRHVSDSHLNLQQLSKALLGLFDLYRLNHNEKLANEAEFRAYYILLNLDSSKNHQADSLSVWFRQCPAVLLKSWELKFARAVLRCYRAGNYRGFFQLAQEATFLQSCLMELHFNEVRLRSLSAMNQGGYKLHPIPLTDIAKQLLMKEGDLEELCTLCGLLVGMDTSRVRCLFVKQSQFSAPKELPSYRCPCIISKQPASYYEEVTGTKQRL